MMGSPRVELIDIRHVRSPAELDLSPKTSDRGGSGRRRREVAERFGHHRRIVTRTHVVNLRFELDA